MRCARKACRSVRRSRPLTAELGASGSYETLGTLGSCCGISDLMAIWSREPVVQSVRVGYRSRAGMTLRLRWSVRGRGPDAGGPPARIDLSWGTRYARLALPRVIVRREGDRRAVA